MNANPESAAPITPEEPTPSTQPEYVLRRATELLNGQAIQIDIAAFTQRILASVEGQSSQELQSLAERYSEATHTPDSQSGDPQALQELALTAAILEGHAQELQPETATVSEEAPTVISVPLETTTTPAVDTVTTMPTEDTEQATEVTTPEVSEEETKKMEQLRADILTNTFGLTAQASIEDVQKVAEALKTTEKKSKIETGLAELMSIEARLGNTETVSALAAESASVESATVEIPIQEPATEEVTEDSITPTTTQAEEKTEEAPTVLIAPVTEEPDTVEQEVPMTTEASESEGGIKIDHAIAAITDDIAALEKTLTRYEDRERDLNEQVGIIERYLPQFMLGEDKLKLVKALNATQVAVAHTRELLEAFRVNLVEVQNANEELELILEEVEDQMN